MDLKTSQIYRNATCIVHWGDSRATNSFMNLTDFYGLDRIFVFSR